MVQKIAYVIVESEKNAKGEYVPCIVKQGETGYYLTDWSWGKDKELAQKIADKQNEGLGITQAEVYDLVLKSMSKQDPVCKATVGELRQKVVNCKDASKARTALFALIEMTFQCNEHDKDVLISALDCALKLTEE